jgi:chromosome segregation ATPase
MLKKLVIAAAAVVVGLAIIKFTKAGRDFKSLTELGWRQAGDWAKSQVAPETRIEQLDMEIRKIGKDIRAAVDKRAGLKAEYVVLKDQIESLKVTQDQRKKDMLTLADLLEQGSHEVVFRGYTFVNRVAQQKLDSLRSSFETGAQTLKTKTELLEAKSQRLVVAEQAILKIQQKQGELTNMVDQLKTQLANIRMKQMENNIIDVDESQVSKCVALQEELKYMLAKEEARAEDMARFGLTPPPAATSAKDEASIVDSIKAARTAVGAETKPVAGGDKLSEVK